MLAHEHLVGVVILLLDLVPAAEVELHGRHVGALHLEVQPVEAPLQARHVLAALEECPRDAPAARGGAGPVTGSSNVLSPSPEYSQFIERGVVNIAQLLAGTSHLLLVQGDSADKKLPISYLGKR